MGEQGKDGPSRAVLPCVQWPGSKARIAPRIVSYMIPHDAYIEPFGGSLAVLLHKAPVLVEVVNDLHGMLTLFYRVLRDEQDELIRLLMLTPYARRDFVGARDDEPGLSDVERARRFFIRINQSFVSANGNGGWTATVHSSGQHSNASKWARFQTRLYAVAERLTTVQIENIDAMELLAKLHRRPDKSCVVYVDPPYLSSTRNGSRYHHDMSTVPEHEALCAELRQLAGSQRQILLSGYANEYYADWLPGWKMITMPTTRNSQSGRGSTTQEECLWISPAVRKRKLVYLH